MRSFHLIPLTYLLKSKIFNTFLYFLFILLLGLLSFPKLSLAQFEDAKRDPREAMKPKRYALVVGINRSVKSAYWPTLRYANRDAKRFAKALQVEGQFDRILQLYLPENTTRKAILNALGRLKKWAKHKEDTVVVYFSAHGTVSRGRIRYIITSDTTQKVPQTALPVRRIRKVLSDFSSRRIGLILATCYTGLVNSKSVLAKGIKGGVKPLPFEKDKAIQILSAASYAQPAFESSSFRSDIYTHFFLECMHRLKHKTIIKIHVCAAHQTTPYVQKLNGEVQVPKAYSELGANRDFLLAHGREQRKKVGYLLSTWRGGKPVVYRVFKAKSKGSSEHILKAANHDLTALQPGRYHVIVQDLEGRVWRRQNIEVRPGQVAHLYTDWALEVLASSIFSDKAGSSLLLGSSIGLRHRFAALRIGVWGARKFFPVSEPSLQLYSELRGEFGFRFEWPYVELFLGGYGAIGMMLSHVAHSTQELGLASLVSAGGTLAFCYWLTSGMGLSLQGSFGMAFFRRQKLVLAPEGNVQFGLSFRL